jgi:hypothetical protein
MVTGCTHEHRRGSSRWMRMLPRLCLLGAVAWLQLLGTLAGLHLPGAVPGPASADPPARRGPGFTGLPLQFDSELIRLYIVADSLEVDGIYRFLCDAQGAPQMTLFYPYPQDSLLGGARMLLLEARAPRGVWQPARFEEMPAAHGGRWWVPLDLGDSLEVRCIYRQARRTNYARYIVTTTRHWQRPLSHARFEIYLPVGATPTSFSFPFRPQEDGAMRYYVYETEQFMPAQDITVEWRSDARK